MACGCQGTCGCNVIGDHVTAEVTQPSPGTFRVSAIIPIRFVEDTDCIDLQVDPETATLTAAPKLAPAADIDASVQLRCTAAGLGGDVVIDPASTAPVSVTPDGLRVDLPAAEANGDSATAGTLRAYAGIGEEPGWVDADGSEVQRLAYPVLHDKLSLVSTQGIRTAGSAVVGNTRTKYLAAGMPAEITGFPPGMHVVSIDGPFTLTVSDVAFSSGGDSIVRVYPYGNGNGDGTFNLPLVDEDGFVKQMVAGEGIGHGGGGSTVTVDIANLPPHEHPGSTATDTGHTHPATASSAAASTATTTVHITADGAHAHKAGTAQDSSFVTILDPVDGADYAAVLTAGGTSFTPGTGGGTLNETDFISIPTEPKDAGDAATVLAKQGNRALTSSEPNHAHAGSTGTTSVTTTVGTSVDVGPATASMTVDIAAEGGGQPLENRPKFRAFRWQVKT